MPWRTIDSVRPLRFIENQFVQVLVHQFTMTRRGTGVELIVNIDDDAPAVCSRLGKSRLKDAIAFYKAADYQKRLDAFLLDGQGDRFVHDDESFPFRYASGGTLPILRMDSDDYYCLFYRDIHPIGWNISNGGCLTREELLNPFLTIERELREELMIVNRFKKIRYLFNGNDGTSLFRSQRSGAFSSWLKIFPELAHAPFKEMDIPAKRMTGPDSLKVQIAGYDSGAMDGCFLNVNAIDFGIELDRIIKIGVPRGAQLCDGEQTGNWVINRLVGLFQRERFDQELSSGSKNFVPDRFFFNAVEHPSSEFWKIFETEAFAHFREFRSEDDWKAFDNCEDKCDLCPVTKRLAIRYGRGCSPAAAPANAKVFITYGGDDEKWARKVYDALRLVADVFFFRDHHYTDTVVSSIDDALDSANCLIAVATSPDNLNRERCAYEWKRFCQDRESGLKPESAVAIPFISGVSMESLPDALRDFYGVPFLKSSFDLDLVELAKQIPRDLRRSASEII